MKITNDKKLIDVQREFTEHFPFLKLEFYQQEHDSGVGSPNALKLNPELTIGAVRSEASSGNLSIHGGQKVSTLEQNFSDQYGLHVQVFRRAGDIWMQTTRTDDWTLSNQNERGAASVNT
ncbi:MAG: hypothetical protein AAFO94_02995 [Bacteroidota bacterium]